MGRTKKEKADDPLAIFRGRKTNDTESNHRTVRKQEDHIAKEIGGKRHAFSGAKDGLKSDGSSERYQFEAKQTQHESLSLKQDWLEKITWEATGKGKVPILHVRFLQERQGVSSDWYIVPAHEFTKLIEKGD